MFWILYHNTKKTNVWSTQICIFGLLYLETLNGVFTRLFKFWKPHLCFLFLFLTVRKWLGLRLKIISEAATGRGVLKKRCSFFPGITKIMIIVFDGKNRLFHQDPSKVISMVITKVRNNLKRPETTWNNLKPSETT